MFETISYVYFILIVVAVHLANFISCKRKWDKHSNYTGVEDFGEVNLLGIVGLFIVVVFITNVACLILEKIGVKLNVDIVSLVMVIISQSIASHDIFAKNGIEENYTYDIYLENDNILTVPEKRKLSKILKKTKSSYDKNVYISQLLSKRSPNNKYKIVSGYTLSHPEENIEVRNIGGRLVMVRVKYEELTEEECKKIKSN